MDVVLSWEIKISLDPKSPSGPPVCNLVTSDCSKPNLAKVPLAYSCTDNVVMPYVSWGMPPNAGGLPVVILFQYG